MTSSSSPDLDPAVRMIATELDKPSVYMGGPSRRSLRRAEDVASVLRSKGYLLNEGEVAVPRQDVYAIVASGFAVTKGERQQAIHRLAARLSPGEGTDIGEQT